MNDMRHPPPQDGDTRSSNRSPRSLPSPWILLTLRLLGVRQEYPLRNEQDNAEDTFWKGLVSERARELKGGGIDYVDFNKGMDTCYLRLSTPECAEVLSSHFDSTPTVQATGLDDTGTLASEGKDMRPIHVEVVHGNTRGSVLAEGSREDSGGERSRKQYNFSGEEEGVRRRLLSGRTRNEEGRSKKRRRK
ncbi:hypothetical protein DFP72DRAFT_325131 [Ephemerocybe angulata]|uniref:La-related protein 7 homolog xRRM domain-containing protein n=1 Tax=Ephemerocybe angulata TaxID=980116 RepID=A0A8H6IG38_9AGAR|nr:hypothetical protein DFP72DRAFT_325131 [Tulosesus angulatus]